MMREVIGEEARDEIVAVVVARLASQRERMAGGLARIREQSGPQLGGEEFVRLALVDEER